MKVLSDCSGYNCVNVDDMVLLSRFQLHSQLVIFSTKAFVSPQFKSVGTSACSSAAISLQLMFSLLFPETQVSIAFAPSKGCLTATNQRDIVHR